MRLAAVSAVVASALVAASTAAADGPAAFRPKIQSTRALVDSPERARPRAAAAGVDPVAAVLLKEIDRLRLENERLSDENLRLSTALQAARVSAPSAPVSQADAAKPPVVYRAAPTASAASRVWLPRWGMAVPAVRRDDGRWEVKAEGGGSLLLDDSDVVPQ